MTDSFLSEIDTAWHPLADGNPPSWASAWGHDEHGVWVEFTLSDVTQRLRWIPPGEFQMGSPEDEPGHIENEGPEHQVFITLGFWLFDTPCTQALWLAVMDENPSRFQSLQRPVETVSWQNCQDFLKKINNKIPDLMLTLPTEAQWEFACRAGEPGAVYTGNLEILGDGNAPGLDSIAWYGGNSGVDFELQEGHDIDYFSDRQYDLNPSGSHPVGLKRPNALGLYDMLGNVWEWCEDGIRDYQDHQETDPLGSTEAGAGRVIRGGSWGLKARDCRCACRSWLQPDERSDLLGFRCARVQV